MAPPRPRTWRDVITADPTNVPYSRGGLGRVPTTHRPAERRAARTKAALSPNEGMEPRLEAALRKVKGGGGGGFGLSDVLGLGRKAFTTAIDVIDTPRAAIVAGIDEFSGAINPEFADPESWWEKTSRNISSAESKTLQAKAAAEGKTGASAAIEGIALDIALDPLTYLAPATTLDDVQRVATRLSTEGAKTLGEAGAKEAAARVLRSRTPSVLTDAELASIGEKGGIYVNLPGKGPVGRTLGVDTLIDKVAGRNIPRQVQIASRQSLVGKAGVAASRGLHKPVAAALNARATQKLTEIGLNGSKPLARAMMRSGDPEMATQGLHGLTTDAEGRYMAHGWEGRAGERASALLKQAKKAGVNGEDLSRALRGDVEAASKIDPVLLSDFQSNTELMRTELNGLADVDGSGQEWVADAGDFYQPRYIDREKVSALGDQGDFLKATMQGPRRGGGTNLVPSIMGRNIEPGTKWWGTEILDPKVAGKPVERQVDEILYRNRVIDQHQLNKGSALWKDDINETLPLYIRMMGNQLATEYTGAKLRQLGIGDSMFKLMTDANSVQKRGILHELTNKLSQTKARQRQAQLWADDRKAALTGATEATARDATQLNEYSGAAFAAADDLQRGTQAWLGDPKLAEETLSGEQVFAQARAGLAEKQLKEGVERLDRLYEYRQGLADKLDGALERAAYQQGGGEEEIARAFEETADEMARADALLNEMEASWGDATSELAHVDDMIQQVDAKLADLKTQLDDANSVLAYTTLLRGSAATDDFAASTANVWDATSGAAARRKKPWLQRQINIGETYRAGLNTRRGIATRGLERANGTLRGGQAAVGEATAANQAEMQRMFDWGRDSLARQYQELGDAAGPELTEAIMRPAIQAEETLAQADREIANMGPSLKSLEDATAANKQRLHDVEAQLSEATADASSVETARLGLAAEQRHEADALYKAAAIDPELGPIAHLEAQAKSAEASLTEANDVRGLTEKQIHALGDDVNKLVPMLNDGWRRYGALTQLPEDLAEAMSSAARITTPDGLKSIVGAWDRVQGLLKSYMVTSPGFHFRNIFGGVTNNWLGNIDEAAYPMYLSAAGDIEQLRRKNPLWAEAYDSFDSRGFHTGGQTAYEIESSAFTTADLKPWSRNFFALRANRQVGEHAENFLRGSMYMDTYVKARRAGMAADQANTQAMMKMLKYHFDYEDLSRVERSIVRRVIPFYTWTRKNLPLQLEMMAKQPEKINRYFKVKRNIETMSEEEGVVPDYFGESFAIRLPFTEGGGQQYAMPDLPIMSLAEITDPGTTAGMVTPLIKTPYEAWAGKQLYKDLPLSDEMKPMPAAFAAIPGLKEGMRVMGWADRGANGQWYASDKGTYVIEQFLPPMARARRLLPSEDKYEDRFWSTMISFNLGLGVRTNTRDEQEKQLWGRYMGVKEDLERAKQLGYITPEEDIGFPGIGKAEVLEAVS